MRLPVHVAGLVPGVWRHAICGQAGKLWLDMDCSNVSSGSSRDHVFKSERTVANLNPNTVAWDPAPPLRQTCLRPKAFIHPLVRIRERNGAHQWASQGAWTAKGCLLTSIILSRFASGIARGRQCRAQAFFSTQAVLVRMCQYIIWDRMFDNPAVVSMRMRGIGLVSESSESGPAHICRMAPPECPVFHIVHFNANASFYLTTAWVCWRFCRRSCIRCCVLPPPGCQ